MSALEPAAAANLRPRDHLRQFVAIIYWLPSLIFSSFRVKNLLLALLVCTTSVATAQTYRANHAKAAARRSFVYTDGNEDLPARNHGTGVRVGSAWTLIRPAATNRQLPTTFEVGVFHQRAISRALSFQGELLYYRDATTTSHSSGMRLPALLVINPFYNVSIHLGPQLQVRTAGVAPRALSAETVVPEAAPAPRLSGGLVVGGEARAGFLRFGVRYALPFSNLVDLSAAGKQAGGAWQSGQVQAYLGAGF